MSLSVFVDDAASIAIAATALGGLVMFLFRGSWRGLGRMRRFLDDYEGTPAHGGMPERPGVMRRLQTIEGMQTAGAQQLATIDQRQQQVVERLESGDVKFDALDGRLGAVEEQLRREMPKNGQPLAVKIDAIYQWIQAQP